MEDKRKMLVCALSLYNISRDLHEIKPEFAKTCFEIAKALTDETRDLELPEAIVHTQSTVHNANIKTEVEAIIKEIQEKE